MAQIKMDVSEWESMKENKKLLENSLETEKILNKKIEVLTKEKIKALESASMRVIKETKTTHTDYLIQKRVDFPTVIRDFCMFLGINYTQTLPSSYGNNNIYDKNTSQNIIERLIDILFKKTTSISHSQIEITTHGLDEIKLELREQLKKELDDSINNRLKKLDEKLIENEELLIKNKSLVLDNNSLNIINENLTKTNKLISDNLDKNKAIFDNYKLIERILKNGFTFWNKSKLLNKIINIIK